jgi:hypothetical protein
MRPVATLARRRSLWQTIGAQFRRCLLGGIGFMPVRPSGYCPKGART